jgi:hypothetical protein
MVIVNYDSKDTNRAGFIDKPSIVSPETPIIVDGSYNNKGINKNLARYFS